MAHLYCDVCWMHNNGKCNNFEVFPRKTNLLVKIGEQLHLKLRKKFQFIIEDINFFQFNSDIFQY